MRLNLLAVGQLRLGALMHATAAESLASTFTPARPPAIPLAGEEL